MLLGQPTLSYLTILDKYIICMLVLMGAAMLGAVIVYNGGEGAHTEAEEWHNTVFNICSKSKCPAPQFSLSLPLHHSDTLCARSLQCLGYYAADDVFPSQLP